MFPAARVTDQMAHDVITPCGVIIPPGFPTVLIEFMPAARMTDLVACTGAIAVGIVHPPWPPVIPAPNLIAKGSATVLTGFLPQARWVVDMTICGAILGLMPMIPMRKTFVGG